MRLRTVLPIAVFVALAACDSKGPPKIGANDPAPGTVTVPMTPPVAAGPACPDPAEIIAKACPPAKVAKAPAKPIKVHRTPPRKKAPARVAAAPAPVREYAPVVAPPAAPREYARVEAPPPVAAQPPRRVVEEEVRETWRTYGAPTQAPPQQAYAPPPAYQPPPQAYYAPPPQQYYAPPLQQYAAPPPAYAYAPRGPCCTYPAAGRDANGFLTWPGKR